MPNVNWNPDNRQVNVNWYNLDNVNQNGGVRREVSMRPCSASRVLHYVFDPAIRHFGSFDDERRNFYIGFFRNDFQFMFYPDEVFQDFKGNPNFYKDFILLLFRCKGGVEDIPYCFYQNVFDIGMDTKLVSLGNSVSCKIDSLICFLDTMHDRNIDDISGGGVFKGVFFIML